MQNELFFLLFSTDKCENHGYVTIFMLHSTRTHISRVGVDLRTTIDSLLLAVNPDDQLYISVHNLQSAVLTLDKGMPLFKYSFRLEKVSLGCLFLSYLPDFEVNQWCSVCMGLGLCLQGTSIQA